MKKLMMKTLILSLLSSLAGAGDNETFDDSLMKTQEFLKNSTERSKAISESKDAQKADEQVKKLAPDNESYEEYYKLASEIMNNYKAEKSEEGMKMSVDDAKRNPADFYNNLTPEQKKKIKALSEKLNPGAQSNP